VKRRASSLRYEGAEADGAGRPLKTRARPTRRRPPSKTAALAPSHVLARAGK
jgi:hypothetical protein